MNFSEKLRSLRREKGISQEKLADYLGISFQAVSKWERGTGMPDISLLPLISRFFGITVDELLCAEKIDEEKLYSEFERRAEDMFRNGERGENHLEIWREACRKMPNNPHVQEHLMSAYYGADKVKYCREIAEIARQLYFSDSDCYFKGQAIRIAAVSCAESGDMPGAVKWASRAGYVMHTKECIDAEIYSGEELLENVRFFIFHALDQIFYMTVKLAKDGILSRSESLSALETSAKIFEELYKNDDADFETLRHIFNLHSLAADFSDDENDAKFHLERACELALKMKSIRAHTLENPLLKGLEIQNAPKDSLSTVRFMQNDLKDGAPARWQDCCWHKEICDKLSAAVTSYAS